MNGNGKQLIWYGQTNTILDYGAGSVSKRRRTILIGVGSRANFDKAERIGYLDELMRDMLMEGYNERSLPEAKAIVVGAEWEFTTHHDQAFINDLMETHKDNAGVYGFIYEDTPYTPGLLADWRERSEAQGEIESAKLRKAGWH